MTSQSVLSLPAHCVALATDAVFSCSFRPKSPHKAFVHLPRQ